MRQYIIAFARPVCAALLLLNSFSHADPPETREAVNQQTREQYRQIIESSSQKYRTFDVAQLQQLYRLLIQHPVARLDRIDPRKPPSFDKTGEIGYCYGRAMAVHLLALRMGLQEDSIRKLFLVGALQGWRFHVTTLVRAQISPGSPEIWVAIDPAIFPEASRGGPVTAQTWIQQTNRIFVIDRAFRYLVPASIVLPDIRTVEPLHLESGRRLIEITFDPRSFEEDFQETDLLEEPNIPSSRPVYATRDLDSAQAFFIGIEEETETDSFDHLGVRIASHDPKGAPVERIYDYRGDYPQYSQAYFPQLMKSILEADPAQFKSTVRKLEALATRSLAAPSLEFVQDAKQSKLGLKFDLGKFKPVQE